METNHCPTCHAPIPTNAPGGFCPACLLRDAEEAPNHGHSAPSLEEIAAAFPRLEVLGYIGQGGMGFVYRARQPELDREVALKILAPELGRDPAFAERFAREARTLGKLHHPNIVTVFEHGESGGLFYLLMEYIDGVNLRQAMRAGRFTPEQALAIVPGICDALQAAHAQGIWHRDIKPENILLDREGRVKIADFGIARIAGDPQRDFTLTMTGHALGSAAYMAPEQHEKPHDVDHRADIYSLGVVIYEMLTGELPLGRFPAPSQRAAVDARIDEIVLQTLEKERELRQQSASEVKTDVHRAMRPGETRTSRPEPVTTQTSGLAKLALSLFLAGVLGSPLLAAILQRADNNIAAFGGICVLLACVLGLMSWRERLGKLVVITTGVLLVVFGALLAVRLHKVRQAEAAARIHAASQVVQSIPKPAPPPPVVEAHPVQIPPGVPIRRRSKPPEPTVSVEEVFRKANAAANESNGEEFKANVWASAVLGVDPVVWDGGSFSQSGMPHLGMMALFAGEITHLNVVAFESSRVPVTNSFEPLGKFTPASYATIRMSNGSLKHLAVSFRNKDGRWVGTEIWFPRYGAFSRIEFKPDKGDAATMLKTHLGSNSDFRSVEGKPGMFDVFGFDEEADQAKVNSIGRVQELSRSLDQFDLGKYLKVISPAEKPELPYMGENEPPFVPEKP